MKQTVDEGNPAVATDDRIARAVEAADPAVLRVTLMHLLPDDERLHNIKTSAAHAKSDRVLPPEITDPDDLKVLRETATQYLIAARDSGEADLPIPSRAQFKELLETFFGHDIQENMMQYWWEEFGVAPLPRSFDLSPAAQAKVDDFEVLVIGAGMNGIAAAVHFKDAGIKYTVVERNDRVGGTWYVNRYPGARVDVASRAYSYTFEPDFPWKHHYAVQPELLDYFEHVVDKYDIRDSIEFNTDATSATWSEDEQMWTVVLTSGGVSRTVKVNAIVSAVGLFNQPLKPAIPGIDSFKGRLIHTAQWPDEIDLSGQRVGVLGTGASGVQVVAPLSEIASKVTVFQRAGTWLAYVADYADPVSDDQQWMLDNMPGYVNWLRLAQVHAISDTGRNMLHIDPDWQDENTVSAVNFRFRETLLDYVTSKLGHRPDLMEKVIPNYPPLARRLPKDNGWYDSLLKDNVELVDSPVAEFTETGVRTENGEEQVLDAVVLATGFNASNYLATIQLKGRDGATLTEAWARDGARAHLGMTIPGFPNFFCLYGPNTNGPSTPCAMGEMQIRYVIQCIEKMAVDDKKSIEVTPEAYEKSNALMDQKLAGMIWMDNRQKSYYLNEFNRVATNGPWYQWEYFNWTLQPDFSEYRMK